MKRLSLILVALFSVAIGAHAGDKYDNAVSVFRDSAVTKPYFDYSYGYAIFPTVGKGGFLLGGAYGSGHVYHRGGQLAGSTQMTQLSLGLLAGAQAFSEIIFFQDERAFREFINGQFEFDTTASVVAVTAGAQAQTGTMGASTGYSAGPRSDRQVAAAYYRGMAAFTHAKGGLMLEASIAGQKFSFRPSQQFAAELNHSAPISAPTSVRDYEQPATYGRPATVYPQQSAEPVVVERSQAYVEGQPYIEGQTYAEGDVYVEPAQAYVEGEVYVEPLN